MVDEDEKIPYVFHFFDVYFSIASAVEKRTTTVMGLESEPCISYSYKIGDSFVSLPLPEVQELLASSTEKIEGEVSGVEEKLSGIRDEMRELKVQLYARFGRSINLET